MRETSLPIGNQLLVELLIRILRNYSQGYYALSLFFPDLLSADNLFHPSNGRVCFRNFTKIFVAQEKGID
jgi:hypothetical protein